MSTRVPARRVVEAVRELLALLGRRAAVQQAPGPALADAQPRHQGQGLRLRRDDDAPLVRGRPELPPTPHTFIPFLILSLYFLISIYH